MDETCDRCLERGSGCRHDMTRTMTIVYIVTDSTKARPADGGLERWRGIGAHLVAVVIGLST